MSNQPLDDIDRLFARLERAAVPADFTARVAARTVPPPAVVWPWAFAGLLAVVLLGVAGYLAGVSLASSSGLDVIELLLGDTSLLATAPGDVLAALGEVMPWQLVALAGASAVLLVSAAGRVFFRSPAVA
jgi:hypothetical protein